MPEKNVNKDLRELAFIVPVFPELQVHDKIAAFLLVNVGGFTRTKCEGAWVDKEVNIHYDVNYKYNTAVVETAESIVIDKVKRILRTHTNELSLYWIDRNGVVHIDELSAKAEKNT